MVQASPTSDHSLAERSRRLRVLALIDRPDLQTEVRQVLEPSHEVIIVDHPRNALGTVRAKHVDFILVSPRFCSGESGAWLELLRGDSALSWIPVLLIRDSSVNDGALFEEERIDDFISSPISALEVHARLRNHLRLARLRRESMERVRETEERFQHVADHSPLMFWVTDAEGRCSYLNERWYEFTGKSKEESLGHGWLSALHEDDRDRVSSDFSKASAARANLRLEYRLRRHDGTFRWMLDSATPRFFRGTFVGYVGSVLDITDEREERDTLARERSQMEMALQAGRIGTFDWDMPTGRVTWSPELEALYGVAPGTFEGSYRGWAQRVVPEDLPRVEQIILDAIERRTEEVEYEFRVVKPDGSRNWMQGKARFYYTSAGRPRRMVGINFDVDHRKRGELNELLLNRLTHDVAMLSDSNEILRTAAERLGEHLTASRCYFVSQNDAQTDAIVAVEWLRDGKAASAVGSYPIADFGSSEVWNYVIRQTTAVSDTARSDLTRGLSGRYRELQIAAWLSAPFIREGKWLASLVVTDDKPRLWRNDEMALVESVLSRVWPILERKASERAVDEAEAKIRDSEERLRVTLEAAQLGTWDYKAATAELFWNARCCELFGLSAEQSITMERFFDRVHADDRERVREAVTRALDVSDGRPYDIDYRTVDENGRTLYWVRASGRAFFRNGQATRFLGVVADISDVVKARETLAERRDELEKVVAERTAKLQETIAELEGFSYSISHDLRAPLRAMQSFAQLFSEECTNEISEVGRDYLRRIVNASQRMDRLIHDVLVYSRASRTELTLAAVDIERLIDGIIESYPQFRDAAADIVLVRPLPAVRGNEAALTQVLANLLGNALKFVAPGQRPQVKIWADVAGSRVQLHVKDNGIGIPRESHDRIFGIFERLSRNYEGTGIGLAVVRKATERMNGRVLVESEPGAGSTFTVELDRA